MKQRTYSTFEFLGQSKTPEKMLWLAVLERLLVDFNHALSRACHSKYPEIHWKDVKSMIRQMDNEHLQWICETCDIHPDRIKAYMWDRVTNRKGQPIDYRYRLNHDRKDIYGSR